MSEFKAFDGGEPFFRPEKPFMLVYESEGDELNIAWLETEGDLLEMVDGVKRYDCKILYAIEIGSCRDIISPEEYPLN